MEKREEDLKKRELDLRTRNVELGQREVDLEIKLDMCRRSKFFPCPFPFPLSQECAQGVNFPTLPLVTSTTSEPISQQNSISSAHIQIKLSAVPLVFGADSKL